MRSPDGKGVIIVPEGYAAIVRPDDYTAVATVEALSCYAYALRLEGASDTYAMMHLREVSNRPNLRDYIKELPSNTVSQQAAFSIPYEGVAAEDRMRMIREILHERFPNITEPIDPQTHGQFIKTGLLITKTSGRSLSQPISQRIYNTEHTWAWRQ